MSGRLKFLSGTSFVVVAALSLSSTLVPMPAALAQQGTPVQDNAAVQQGAAPAPVVETTDNAGMGTAATVAPAPVTAAPLAPLPAEVVAAPATSGPATSEPAAVAPGDATHPQAATAAEAPAPLAPAPLAPVAAPATQNAVTESPVPAAAPAATDVATPAPETAPVTTEVAAPAPATAPATTDVATPAPEATPSAPPPAAVAEAPAVDAVAMQIAALLEGKALDAIAAQKDEREAIAAFYTARGGAPVFTAGHDVSPLGKAVLKVFAASALDGLSPSDYAVALPRPDATDAEVADAELKLAATTLTYARHLQSGRFDPKRISENVDPTRTPPDPAAVLQLVTTAPDVSVALASFAPQYPGYAALKAKLADMLPEQDVPPPPQVPQGRVLRPNMSDPRVPILRVRLGFPAQQDNLAYDHDLVDAVKAFQKKSGQPPSGIIGKATISAMNDTGERRVADIVANMERWRWLPHEVAPSYVMVNIPEFMVRVVRDGKLFHETKVVVGKPTNPTPLLTHDMEYVVFNPSWNVPPGIARKEMLPRLAADPYYLARQGIDVVRNGRVVDPGMVDWSRGTQGYSFRQPPGERNALGRIKFMFPNKHSVYLHDTPSRSLFANARRAFSHGCVRVYEPLKFGEAIFALGMPQDPWSQKRISRQLGGREKYTNLKQHFPVHLVYFTNFVNEDGNLVKLEDLYGLDAQTKMHLGLEGTRRVADRRVSPAR